MQLQGFKCIKHIDAITRFQVYQAHWCNYKVSSVSSTLMQLQGFKCIKHRGGIEAAIGGVL